MIAVKSNRLFWWIVVFGLIGFLLLAGKNPFSTGSIIPNLEPYPDTLYYSTPVWNFIHGNGWTMSYEGQEVVNITPPLYSIYLLPFFALFNDVRAFYVGNMLLSIAGIFIFFQICRKIFGRDLFALALTAFLGFFLIANFYVYTLPTLLLAENLALFLVISATYFLTSAPVNRRTSVLLGLSAVLLLLVKFSNFPLVVALFSLYGLKILKDRKSLFFFAGYSVFLAVIFVLYFLFGQGREEPISNQASLFNLGSFMSHSTYYLRVLLGGDTIFLWFRERMTAPLMAILSAAGIFLGFYQKKLRIYSFQMTTLIFLLVIALTFFYVVDTRYIFALYPASLILAGLALAALKNKFGVKITLLLMGIVAVLILFVPNQGQRANEMSVVTLARRTLSNLRGSETPWYYISVTEFNKFFSQEQHKGAYLGTFLPPFFVDFYSKGTYKYVPLSTSQDFFSDKGDLAETLGIKDIKSFYTKLLSENRQLYVSNVFVNNLPSWVKEFDALKQTFRFELVHQGCFETCNIYKVELK